MARVQETAKPLILHDNQGNITAEYAAEMVETIKNTVAKGATTSELMMFLSVANKYDLDPFLHEIYYVKMGEGEKEQGTIMTSRDGYAKIAKREQDFLKCQSMEVRENDKFNMSFSFGELTNIEHSFSHMDRGKIVGAYAVLKTKSGNDLATYVTRDEYDTGKSAWKKYKSAMIKKVAENEVYKKFADVNGLSAFESMPSDFTLETNEDTVESLETGEFIEVNNITEEE